MLAGGLQHADNGLVGSDSHFLHDLLSVYVGAYGIESDARLRVPHLGFEKCRHESGRHLLESTTLLFVTDEFHGCRDLVHVTFQGGF